LPCVTEKKGVAVCRRLQHRFRGEDAAGAGAVLDHHGLAKRLGHALAHAPREHVGHAAGGRRHQHANGLRREIGLAESINGQ